MMRESPAPFRWDCEWSRALRQRSGRMPEDCSSSPMVDASMKLQTLKPPCQAANGRPMKANRGRILSRRVEECANDRSLRLMRVKAATRARLGHILRTHVTCDEADPTANAGPRNSTTRG